MTIVRPDHGTSEISIRLVQHLIFGVMCSLQVFISILQILRAIVYRAMLLLFSCICVWTTYLSLPPAPRLDLDSPESGYHGLVKENETLVEVTPQIRAIGAKVCSFRIANKHHGDAPFEIVLKEKGMAELRALRVLNCEKRRNYKFDIEAVGCNGSLSEKYELHWINLTFRNQCNSFYLLFKLIRCDTFYISFM